MSIQTISKLVPELRQLSKKSISKYVSQNIVIEVDGDQHKNQQAHDESRDAALRSMNFKVLRFSARDVRETPALITNKILENIM